LPIINVTGFKANKNNVMKTSFWFKMRPKPAVLALMISAISLGSPPSHACEGCSLAMAHRLFNSDSPTLHAAEMQSLIHRAEGPAAEQYRNSLASFSLLASSRPSQAGTPAAPVSLEEGTAAPFQIAQARGPGASRAPAHPFANIIERDRKLGIRETSYVPPGTKVDKTFTIEMEEGSVFIGNGVIYNGFTVNGTIPGPTLVMDEGDVVELTVVNNGEVPHGVSLHAVYTQTSKYFGRIAPGESKSHIFRATHPGIYMYHCAPGGHAIPMHTLLGQYGMMVVKPKKMKFKMDEVMKRSPDLEIFLIQHELYTSGKDAVEGKPEYVMFNGSLFRYVSDPIKAKPGDFVRIHFLNVGPNIISTLHLVGILWDYAYWQGLPNPENMLVGGQTVLAGPSDSWVVDFRVPPDEGAYLIVTHAFGSTTRGAIGILSVSNDHERSPTIYPEGPKYSTEEFEALLAKSVRTISPFEPGTDDLANPFRLPYGETKLRVSIVGNSFYPKVAEVSVGTTVEWTNNDVFTFFEGEFSGLHDVKSYEGPEDFWSPMLGHAEKWSMTLTQPGEYKYICTPHPYMEGIIIVR
jgi:nitrite reductase (NO-forming)